MDLEPKVLCYPNFNLNDLIGIKHALFLYDRVNVIAPTMTPRYMTPLTPADVVGGEPTRLPRYGALDGFLEQCKLRDGSSGVELIDDREIAQNRGKEFKAALEEDINDAEVDAWELEWKKRHGARDYTWFVSPGYFTDVLEMDIKPDYHIESVQDKEFGELLKVPFRVGMSLGLSEALWAAVDKECTLFTVDPTSEAFLMLRLKRGWTHLTQNHELQSQLDIESTLAKGFATARLGTWTLGLKVPGFFKKVPSMRIEEIIAKREDSDKKHALKEFRSGLAKIVTSEGLWKAKDFNTFKQEAVEAADKNIKPAFEVLEKRKDSLRDLMTTFDLGSAISQTVKDVPKLFVSSATATAGAVSIGLLAGVQFVPAALFGLACGLTANTITKFVEERRERLNKLHNAQFVTYPLSVRQAIDKK